MSVQLTCFDLEGPLSPQDHASELLGQVPQGQDLFRVISRYDDLLALQRRIDYEPGDTLVLILPYFIRHGIGSAEIRVASERATLVDGAREVIARSRRDGQIVYVVSTSYEPHAKAIGARLGLPGEFIVATQIEPDQWNRALSDEATKLLDDARQHILDRFCRPEFTPTLDEQIVSFLDELYWNKLPSLGVFLTGGLATVVGGRRKVWALEQIARRHQVSTRDVVFVGDSITDAAVLRSVDLAGGLAISFNGNQFAVEACTLAVADLSLTSLLPVLDAWKNGKRAAVRDLVDSSHATGRTSFDWVWYPSATPQRLDATVTRHARVRAHVRQHAAGLG